MTSSSPKHQRLNVYELSKSLWFHWSQHYKSVTIENLPIYILVTRTLQNTYAHIPPPTKHHSIYHPPLPWNISEIYNPVTVNQQPYPNYYPINHSELLWIEYSHSLTFALTQKPFPWRSLAPSAADQHGTLDDQSQAFWRLILTVAQEKGSCNLITHNWYICC